MYTNITCVPQHVYTKIRYHNTYSMCHICTFHAIHCYQVAVLPILQSPTATLCKCKQIRVRSPRSTQSVSGGVIHGNETSLQWSDIPELTGLLGTCSDAKAGLLKAAHEHTLHHLSCTLHASQHTQFIPYVNHKVCVCYGHTIVKPTNLPFTVSERCESCRFCCADI